MDAHSLTTSWVVTPAALLAVFLVSTLGALAAFELTQRVRIDATPTRRRSLLMAGGLALGTGLWAGHPLMLSAAPQAIRLGYGGGLILAAWVLAVAGSIAALALVAGALRPTGGRAAQAAALLAFTLLGAEVLSLRDLGLVPGVSWDPVWLLAGGIGVALCCGPVLALAGRRMPRMRGHERALAASGIGLALALGHATVLRGAPIQGDAVALHQGALPLQSVGLLAATGAPLLLAMLLALAFVKARLRRELAAAVAAVETAARTDPLTGLPNRVGFERQLEAAARAADTRKGSMAVFFISLDDFKPVNDSFGRAVGDRVLRRIADRLRDLATPALPLARVGGDDFALLHPADLGSDAVNALARRLLDSVGQLNDIDGREIAVSCSIGMVRYPRHGAWSTMLLHGEAAAQTAKRTGGAAAAFFEPHMLAGAREHIDLLRDLRQAVTEKQLELHYQPKIDAASGEITGAEALLRWNHPTRGLVSPGVFIPLAERHGQIGPIGNWLIEEACRQLRAWRDQGLRMRVAINLSVIQLRQADLAQRIGETLQRYKVDPRLLTCEITESLAMEDTAVMARFFERLAAVGVHISIDDFGTGYSSLSYLRKLPAEELKIDRSFVTDVDQSADARAVVDAVVRLAHALGLKVVAEGVETEAQRRVLCELGCDQLQGYLFAKPMPARVLGVWAMGSDGPTALSFRDSLFTPTAPVAL